MAVTEVIGFDICCGHAYVSDFIPRRKSKWSPVMRAGSRPCSSDRGAQERARKAGYDWAVTHPDCAFQMKPI
jgi:hypothetical protein